MIKGFIKIIFLSLLFFVSGYSYAYISKTDTSYIKNYSDRLVFSLTYGNGINATVLQSRSTGRLALNYYQNSPIKIGFNISYKFIYIPVSIGLPADPLKGRKAQSIRITPNYFGRSVWFMMKLARQKGFYLDNFKVLDPNYLSLHNNHYPIRNDLLIYDAALSATYLFNHKHFSSSSIFSFTERQRKSSGSFLAGYNSYFSSVSGDSSLVPYSLLYAFPKDQSFKTSGTLSFGLSFGYTHTFVLFRSLFLNLTALPSLNAQGAISRSIYNERSRYYNIYSFNGFGYAALGRNTDRAYYGLTFVENLQRDSKNGPGISKTQTTVNVFLGIRFFGKKETWRGFEVGDRVEWESDGKKHQGTITERLNEVVCLVQEEGVKEPMRYFYTELTKLKK